MSYKLNQQDPTRRERIRARRTKEPVQAMRTKPVYGNGPMKISNRRAMMRRLALRVKRREITVEEAENLTPLVLSGYAERQQVYGFHPTRK